MNNIPIEEQIRCALIVEQQTQTLEQALQANYAQVARLVELDETNAGKQLLEFVTLYIHALPSLLADFRLTAKKAGLLVTVKPLLDAAYSFFELPPHKLHARSGLTALMVKAYLAHRLLEEVNDACLFHVGRSMIPIDMTLTNTIIHTLIGEPFANELDAMVNSAVGSMFEQQQDSGNALMQQLTDTNLVHIWQRLPSLSSTSGLKLSLRY